MDILVGFLLLFLLLLVSSLKGLFAGYALIIGLFFFIWVGRRHGYPLAKLIQMSLRGGLKSLIVLQIFFLIGIIISVWMAAGTIPAIVFYGIKPVSYTHLDVYKRQPLGNPPPCYYYSLLT